ncbi:MAG: hypothetical protein OCD01_05450 [Fibrobacterales bacterium]
MTKIGVKIATLAWGMKSVAMRGTVLLLVVIVASCGDSTHNVSTESNYQLVIGYPSIDKNVTSIVYSISVGDSTYLQDTLYIQSTHQEINIPVEPFLGSEIVVVYRVYVGQNIIGSQKESVALPLQDNSRSFFPYALKEINQAPVLTTSPDVSILLGEEAVITVIWRDDDSTRASWDSAGLGLWEYIPEERQNVIFYGDTLGEFPVYFMVRDSFHTIVDTVWVTVEGADPIMSSSQGDIPVSVSPGVSSSCTEYASVPSCQGSLVVVGSSAVSNISSQSSSGVGIPLSNGSGSHLSSTIGYSSSSDLIGQSSPLDVQSSSASSSSNVSSSSSSSLTVSSSDQLDFDTGEYDDIRDGTTTTYHWVDIAGTIWFIENVQYEVPTVVSYCLNDASANCDQYGRLYPWESVDRACPTHWRVSTDEDWKHLEKALGIASNIVDSMGVRGSDMQVDNIRSNNVLWGSGNEGTNLYKMNILPSGMKSGYPTTTAKIASFVELGAFYWTSDSVGSDSALIRYVGNDGGIMRKASKKYYNMSIRCVFDR